jgi:hypothetical protein
MLKEDLVKCPVCGVFTRIDKSELSVALANHEIRQQIEDYVAQLLANAPAELAGVATTAEPRNFQTDVHNWNPALPMWQRSPKE